LHGALCAPFFAFNLAGLCVARQVEYWAGARASASVRLHLNSNLHLKALFTFFNKVRMGMIEVLPRAMSHFDQFYIGVDLLFVTFTASCGRHLKNFIVFLKCL
jgi:hypothetical protein